MNFLILFYIKSTLMSIGFLLYIPDIYPKREKAEEKPLWFLFRLYFEMIYLSKE